MLTYEQIRGLLDQMGRLAYEYRNAIEGAQGADYILGKYIDKFGEDLFMELENQMVEGVVDAIQETVESGSDDGVDSQAEVQVDTAVSEVLSDGGEEE